MQQVMLFGEGRNGEVREIEDGRRKLRYIPDETFPLGEVVFIIKEYQSDDGEMYLVGYHDREPLMPDVEDAIQRYKPIPI
ncbi:hypothetical protein AB6I73_000051 [Citrobacter amalonaticus]|uniref:hypothetical protein n=1 Tax=Citrobacter TaxID=544 RepID=UPI001C7D8B19|nr:hypothetical protein [Citrobacter amalonaticus]QZA38296.1 hypothetical protein K1713_10040 [Citrobacter amalonaticus]